MQSIGGTTQSPNHRVGETEVGPPPVPELPAPWEIRVLRPYGEDLDLVHDWMHRPHVAAAWDQAWDVERWADELARQFAGDHSRPCLVSERGEAVAYVEIYRAVRDRLAPLYPVRSHDLGVHVAIGDVARTGRGLGRALLRAVAEGLLAADPACTRVVAEPNVTNGPSLRAFAMAGFHRVGEVTFPHKTAALLVHPRGGEDLPVLG